jgi:hypothetical protein
LFIRQSFGRFFRKKASFLIFIAVYTVSSFSTIHSSLLYLSPAVSAPDEFLLWILFGLWAKTLNVKTTRSRALKIFRKKPLSAANNMPIRAHRVRRMPFSMEARHEVCGEKIRKMGTREKLTF